MAKAKQPNWLLIAVIGIVAVFALVWFFKSGAGPGQAGATVKPTTYDGMQDRAISELNMRVANVEVLAAAQCCVPLSAPDDPVIDFACRKQNIDANTCTSIPDCKWIC